MSVFEPTAVLATLKSLEAPSKQASFAREWTVNVEKRAQQWEKNRSKSSQSVNTDQLLWDAHIVEYVNYMHEKRKVKGAGSPKILRPEIPLYGPRFMPPTPFHSTIRQISPQIEPKIFYIKPLNIVHPFYYSELRRCPRNSHHKPTWKGWTGAGPREVHGMFREERALGFQLRCPDCASGAGSKSENKAEEESDEILEEETVRVCTSTTNAIFWEKWQHYEIPRGIPHFSKCCALTHELYDFIVEVRPSLTSGGMAEHIKQLHLTEYHKNCLDYVKLYELQGNTPFKPLALKAFSSPFDTSGYDGTSITDDLITDIFCNFTETTRHEESAEYLQTLSVLLFDHTFRTARKANIISSDGDLSNPLKGGLFNVINEDNEIVYWSMANDEINESLQGLKQRYTQLDEPDPDEAIADNCCHIESAVKPAFPHTHVGMDVYHFVHRYTDTLSDGTKNPKYTLVAADLTNAILKVQAKNSPTGMAEYRSAEEQTQCTTLGNITVHEEQMKHVRKGCLTRTRNDIRSDGSRIEGTHKGWNSLQRAQPSGLVMMTALGSDFVLRRNLRTAWSRRGNSDFRPLTRTFVDETYGSHHIRLVNQYIQSFNALLSRSINKTENGKIAQLPALRLIHSGEKFGLVCSEHPLTFGGLFVIKTEFDEDIIPGAELEPEVICEVEPGMATSFATLPSAGPSALETISNVKTVITSMPESSGNWSVDINDPNLITMDLDESEQLSHLTSLSTVAGKRKAIALENHLDVKKPRLATSISSPIHPFFSLASASAPLPAPSSFPNTPVAQKTDVSDLIAPLPLPPSEPMSSTAPNGPKLSRSQIFFQLHTEIHPDSLIIKGDDQFFLFMDMREGLKWTSFGMTPNKWVTATTVYNQRLSASQPNAVPKTPRALLKKLAEVEEIIHNKIAKNDFTSHSGQGSERFWKRHCYSVSLTKPGNESSSRKQATCQQCGRILYLGPTNSSENHKRLICSDGAPQKSKVPILYPQPDGIFTRGKEFHALTFLSKVRELYGLMASHSGTQDVPMEYWAFAELFISNMKQGKDGDFLFNLSCLGNIALAPNTPGSILVTIDDIQYLRVSSLR
ncbi:hypothetical protein BDP27DRAFT_1412611 [Rhodocollybia butyracea]|uniref:Uncharacterized protein n=1 Tax=Rhodocollybia butyracea TaxID=206335 RepID=A0A9P5UGQ7_9AGAR|nr:hypothetical protein BDP27DRAFT_1412611 [Rhodocollybia butyracea]